MKTPKPSLKKKYPYIIIIPIVLIIAAIAIYVIFASNKTRNNSTTTDNTSSSSSNDTNKSATPTTEGLPSDSTTTTSDQIPTSDTLTISIDSFTQSGGLVTATASSNNSGTCVFAYKPADGGKPVTKQEVVTNNKCITSISEGEFTYIGDWILTVTYYNNSQKAEAQKNVTIY